jgi:carbamoylphosphate synthase small subunit
MSQFTGGRLQATKAPNLEPCTLSLAPDAVNLRVVVMDFGVKRNILRILKQMGCEVIVVPAWEKAETILSLKPDGVLLSNGPGDPEGVPYAITEIRKLFGSNPIRHLSGATASRLLMGEKRTS